MRRLRIVEFVEFPLTFWENDNILGEVNGGGVVSYSLGMQKTNNLPVHGFGNCAQFSFIWIALFQSEEGIKCLKEIIQVNMLKSLWFFYCLAW